MQKCSTKYNSEVFVPFQISNTFTSTPLHLGNIVLLTFDFYDTTYFADLDSALGHLKMDELTMRGMVTQCV